MYNKTWNKHNGSKIQQRINNNRTIALKGQTLHFFGMEKQYSENVSIDAIDNNIWLTD